MREFLLKDFHLHRRYILALGVLFPFYIGLMSTRVDESPRVFALLSAFMYAIVALVLYTREDKFKAVGLSVSLPSTRRRVILGRYLMSWAVMLSLWTLGTAISLLWPGPGLKPSDFIGAGAVLAVLSYMTACLGVFHPLIVRFGLAGFLAFVVGMQVLGVAALALRLRLSSVKALIGSVGKGIAAAQATLGPAGAVAAVLAALLFVNWVSFEVSAALFKRREF